MRIIALFGRGDIGKTRCLGHLINLIYRETMGCNLLYEGQDRRVSLDYKGNEYVSAQEITKGSGDGSLIRFVVRDKSHYSDICRDRRGRNRERVSAT